MVDPIVLKRVLPYGLGVAFLGLVGLAFGDFALQWQPVPPGTPLRTELAYLCALVLVVGGLGLIARPASAQAALALGFFFALWAAVLHLPKVIPNLAVVGAWNGIAEITALACGGLGAWALTQRPSAAPIVQRVFAVCPLVFGLAHFVYADFTASMVPAWIPPSQIFWAYATGVGHLAAGLSLLTGVMARVAATALTGMYASFALLLHLPRVIANPGKHEEWVMLAVSFSLTGAAWIVRDLTVARTSARPSAAERGSIRAHTT